MDALQTEALLQPVLADLADVVDGIADGQLHWPTPNSQRDVATLRSHTFGWLTAFAAGYNDPNGDVRRGKGVRAADRGQHRRQPA